MGWYNPYYIILAFIKSFAASIWTEIGGHTHQTSKVRSFNFLTRPLRFNFLLFCQLPQVLWNIWSTQELTPPNFCRLRTLHLRKASYFIILLLFFMLINPFLWLFMDLIVRVLWLWILFNFFIILILLGLSCSNCCTSSLWWPPLISRILRKTLRME